MRNKNQARDRRRGEVEDEMNPEHTIASQIDATPKGARRLSLLFEWLAMFFERVANGGRAAFTSNHDWRRAIKILAEIREDVGNGPVVQSMTVEILEKSFRTAAAYLAVETSTVINPDLFIQTTNDGQRRCPLDMTTYEHLLQPTYVPTEKLDELRMSYWKLLVELLKRAGEHEAPILTRVRALIAKAHWQDMRDRADEQGYRKTCNSLGLDPGPAWNQSHEALMRV